MRKFIVGICSALLISSAAVGQSTYTGTRTIGNLTANVTLTTDGTLGALSRANIVNFIVNFSDGKTITGDLNSVSYSGDALMASSSQIGFNFDYPANDYFALVGQDATVLNALYCVQTSSGCGASGAGEVANTFDGPGHTQFAAARGFVSLFNLVTSVEGSVPEPATWAMMLFGFVGIGFVMRRKNMSSALPQLA